MRKIMLLCVALVLISQALAHAALQAKVVQSTGEVKVRRSVEENWEPASVGLLLHELDTIMTLENGEVVLELDNHTRFRLGGNAILEINDLREISARELFLLLMSEKVSKLQPSTEKIPLRVGEVSAVHGAEIRGNERAPAHAGNVSWQMEANAARALQSQNFLPNAALKWRYIQTRFPQRDDCGETSLALAQTFEALQQPGRARDAYQTARAECQAAPCATGMNQNRMATINAALRRLQ